MLYFSQIDLSCSGDGWRGFVDMCLRHGRSSILYLLQMSCAAGAAAAFAVPPPDCGSPVPLLLRIALAVAVVVESWRPPPAFRRAVDGGDFFFTGVKCASCHHGAIAAGEARLMVSADTPNSVGMSSVEMFAELSDPAMRRSVASSRGA